jgi:flagellar motor switch protein FliN/FliY
MSSEPVRMDSTSRNLDPKRPASPESASRIGSDLLAGVRISLEARLGDAPMTVEDLMGLKTGAVVALETGLADHVDLYLNDALVARGEIVVVGSKYGVRITELASRP